ncbi:hypothetical protein FrEUN1fDRAFT_5703 [Parafrankia sp. EUN1f]|nr:hypothetical protein FrEUN1fDRAFT_5703 [Parafrankia sp. EUN1f]
MIPAARRPALYSWAAWRFLGCLELIRILHGFVRLDVHDQIDGKPGGELRRGLAQGGQLVQRGGTLLHGGETEARGPP